MAPADASVGEVDDAHVAAFRARLAELPATKDGTVPFDSAALSTLSDSDCCRYLRARDHKVEAAAEMARCAMEWRIKFGIDNVGPGDISIALPQGCWRFAGWAHDGRPIMLIRADLWKPSEYSVEEYNKYVGFMMDNNIARGKNGQEQQIVLFDMTGFSRQQANFEMLRTLITINQEYYPERLSLGVILNAPRLFQWVWSIIYPWIDAKTRRKIKLLGTKDNVSELLLEHIEPRMLETQYGGTRPCPYPIPPAHDDFAEPANAGLQEDAAGNCM